MTASAGAFQRCVAPCPTHDNTRVHLDGAGRADAREVVAHEVDDHEVLAAVLLALAQPARRALVGLGRRAARRRALDRAGLHERAVGLEEALGRRAADGEPCQPLSIKLWPVQLWPYIVMACIVMASRRRTLPASYYKIMAYTVTALHSYGPT